MNRGDIVVIDFPYSDLRAGKVRPALVVQNDRDNRRLKDSIFAMVTGNTAHAGEPTHYLVDPATPEGASSSLHGPSVVLCRNLHTIRQDQVLHTIGSLSDATMRHIDDCLTAALGIP